MKCVIGHLHSRPKMVYKVDHRWSLSAWTGLVCLCYTGYLENEALRAAELIVPQRFIHDQQQQTRQERQGNNNQPSQLENTDTHTYIHAFCFYLFSHFCITLKTESQMQAPSTLGFCVGWMCKTALPWASLTSHHKGLCLASWCLAHTTSSSSPSADTLLWFSQSPIESERKNELLK